MRVLVADNVAKVRFALRVLLGQRPGLELVGEAVNAGELTEKARETSPDVILLDWRLRGLGVSEMIAEMRSCCPDVYLIILSDRPEARQEAMQIGADAFVSKVDPPERLVAAIDSARVRAVPTATRPSAGPCGESEDSTRARCDLH